MNDLQADSVIAFCKNHSNKSGKLKSKSSLPPSFSYLYFWFMKEVVQYLTYNYISNLDIFFKKKKPSTLFIYQFKLNVIWNSEPSIPSENFGVASFLSYIAEPRQLTRPVDTQTSTFVWLMRKPKLSLIFERTHHTFFMPPDNVPSYSSCISCKILE